MQCFLGAKAPLELASVSPCVRPCVRASVRPETKSFKCVLQINIQMMMFDRYKDDEGAIDEEIMMGMMIHDDDNDVQ